LRINIQPIQAPSTIPSCLADFDLPEYDEIIQEIFEHPAPQQVIAPVSSSASTPLSTVPANESAKPAEDAKKELCRKSSLQSLATVDMQKLNQDDFKRIRHAKKNQQWLDEVNERAQKDKARSAELSKGTERLLKEERAKRMQAKEKSQIPATFEGIFGETIKLGATQQRKDKKKKSKEGSRNFK